MLLLAVLLAPIPKSPYKDGGTREYCASTYKIVDWNRLTSDGVHDATKVYWFPNNFKSIDELWAEEEQEVVHRFIATVLELSGCSVLVQPIVGEEELQSSDKISVNTTNLGDIGAEVGSDVEIYYTGGIMESYPAQINAIKWTMADDLRHREYTGRWLDQENATSPGYDPVSDIIPAFL